MSWMPTKMGDRLKIFRRRKNLTQEQLAALAKLPSYLISRLENDRERTTREVLVKIALALDVKVQDITGTGKRQKLLRTRDKVWKHDPDSGCGRCRFRYLDHGIEYYLCLAMPASTPLQDTIISGRGTAPDTEARDNCPLRSGRIIIENPKLLEVK